ncbi:lymphocyte antigen 6 complex locus protein G6f isoform X2 [Heterocephalus glaber]|uniref:Lymphocyte antigen 6 complex locus protein G6f isoform X2 n=1 Tax=Heterocephalus glaber TaxID=10181 RepID=A0AAX6PA09_HETGA|nr:lymphocyte antigen 6 complex locus protein G6f isoform X2 [Heterocephalus glaber]
MQLGFICPSIPIPSRSPCCSGLAVRAFIWSVSSGERQSRSKRTWLSLPMAASLFFLLFLCGPSQAAVDHLPVYVALGEAMELPCPLPRVLRGDEFLSWFHSPAAGTSTTQLAQVQVAATVPHFGQTRRDPRLKLLGNYSLWLAESEDADAGRYWCTVLGQHLEYQNWRVYDVSVMRGSQFSARAADGSSCSVLRCSAVPARRLDSVGWREGKGLVRGRAQAFWNEGAALLLVCPGEGHPEPRGRRPRIIRCLMTQDKGISFSLPASADPSPTLCVPSMGWDVPRILMLLLTVGQGFTILALSIVLWRRRVHGVQGQDASVPQFKPEIQVYENIHLARLRPPAHKTR